MKKFFNVNEWTGLQRFILNEKMITKMCIMRKRCSICRRKCFSVNGFFLIGICSEENKIKICVGIYNFVIPFECLCYCIG